MTKAELEDELKYLKKQHTIMWNALVALKKSSSETVAKGNTTNPLYVFEITGAAIAKIEFITNEFKGDKS